MELKLNKRYIFFGVIIVSVFIIIIIGFYWYVKCNQTMKLLGEALINKDIELMDELFDWECVMFPVGGGERKYSYQRDVIKEIWNTKNFQITSYDYTIMSLGIQHFLHPTWQCFFEMRIIDSYGNEYILTSLVNIRIENFYDFKIIHSNTRLTENPI